MSDSEFDDDNYGIQLHPLFKAISRGDLYAVKRLITGFNVDEYGTDMMADNGHTGHTPLERAAYSGRVDIVKFLLEEGADINRRGWTGDTPLLAALSCPKTNDHITCVKVLLAAGARVNGNSPLTDYPLDKVIGIRQLAAALPPPHWNGVVPNCRRMVSILFQAGATISDLQWRLMESGTNYHDDSIYPYIVKVMQADGFKAYAKAHRQKLVAMFVRTRCFQPVPDEIVPLIVDYSFHVGFY